MNEAEVIMRLKALGNAVFVDNKVTLEIKKTTDATMELIKQQKVEIEALRSAGNSLKMHLEDYKNAEEQGMLVRLPCKVGDKTYTVGTNCVDNPHPERMCFCMGKSCVKCDKHFMQVWENTHHTNSVASIVAHMGLNGETHSFGTNIFLTKAEALQALKERES